MPVTALEAVRLGKERCTVLDLVLKAALVRSPADSPRRARKESGLAKAKRKLCSVRVASGESASVVANFWVALVPCPDDAR